MVIVRLVVAMLIVWPMLVESGNAQMQGIQGVWWTDKNKGRVQIAQCTPPKQGLCGTIIWISEPNDPQGRPQTDKKNKDSRLRGRPVVGLEIFSGWRPAGNNAWKGEVYDPEEGDTFDVDISLAGDKLVLRGCVLFLCDSDTWTRYRG